MHFFIQTYNKFSLFFPFTDLNQFTLERSSYSFRGTTTIQLKVKTVFKNFIGIMCIHISYLSSFFGVFEEVVEYRKKIFGTNLNQKS